MLIKEDLPNEPLETPQKKKKNKLDFLEGETSHCGEDHMLSTDE